MNKVFTGFVCRTEAGLVSTLKRSGSDYSATVGRWAPPSPSIGDPSRVWKLEGNF